MKALLPVGSYAYEKNKYSFDEAWEKLKRSYEKNEFVVCFGLSESEDGAYINVDYHNIRGKIFRGYLTQNRGLHSNYFIGKSFCISISKLNERAKSFVATHIPVEEESKKQLSSLGRGDRISGVISYIGGESSYAFVDVKEGLAFFLAAKNLSWRPVGCMQIEPDYSLGDTVTGTINFVENFKKPQHSTLGSLTCLNFKENWERETAELKIGTKITGTAKPELLSGQTYYIPVSQLVYIEFESEDILPIDKEVSVTITQIDEENHIVKALLLKNDQEEEEKKESGKNGGEKEEQTGGAKPAKMGSLFDLEIKALVSPFEVRENEEIEFESAPNSGKSFQIIQQRIKSKQINEIHFNILKAINLFIFSTSKQILAWLYCNGQLSEKLSQAKLNQKLETMSKLGLVDRIRFKSRDGEGIFRVYFLNKNGERLLSGYLRTRSTSYNDALLVTPVSEIKRHLATNQILLSYKETLGFLRSFTIRKILNADEKTPIRPSAMIAFPNSVLLVETRRRFPGWKEELFDKMKRYQLLFRNYQTGVLPANSVFLLKKRLYLLIVCEDKEQALEIHGLFLGHMYTLYPHLFFTYDLLIFHKGVNYSIFRFEMADLAPVHYNVTDLLGYDLYHKETQIKAMQVEENQTEKEKMEDAEQVVEFRKCLERDYFLGLDYLRKHKGSLLEKMVAEEMKELFARGDDGDYGAVYPEEKQYYVYLLHLLNYKMIKSLSAAFLKDEAPERFRVVEEVSKQEEITMPEVPSPDDLERAVKRVAERLEEWCRKSMNTFEAVDSPFQIDKRPVRQTSGTQYGYDVGMNFTYHGEKYRLGFECKNYQTLLKEMQGGKDARLLIGRYAYNLLEFFMEAERNVHNIWTLISPFGDLQNNFFEKLFEKWNQVNDFMKLRVFSTSQTGITCEEFLSLDEEAYHSIYQHEPPKITEEERNRLTERIFYTIVDPEEWDAISEKTAWAYPQELEDFDENEQMELKTLQGESILEQICERLGQRQNIFLVGEYGTGKTFMTYRLIRRALTKQEIFPYLPLWFKLSDRTQNLMNNNVEEEADKFVGEKLELYDDFAKKYKRNLKMGKCVGLVILDGLDEVVSGLGESELKFLFLEQVCKKTHTRFREKYACTPLFLITSRELDFKSCMEGRENVSFFNKFASIVIAEFCEGDAVLKLREIEEQMGQGSVITQNSQLMSIARRPLYFGFIRELIRARCEWDEAVDELDVLQTVIEKSVQRYISEGSTQTKAQITERLHDWARAISIQMTDGGSSEIPVHKYMLPSEAKNNVICLRKTSESFFALRFYHNAIREYLVAEELYQDIRDCINGSTSKANALKKRLQQLALTSEMIGFFAQLAEKNSGMKPAVIEQIKKMLKMTVHPSERRMGTNLFSMLYHLQNELIDLDLHGIYAEKLYLWNCTLKRIDFRNAHIGSLRLFNVFMEEIDLRGADLSGLIMGKDDKILDVQHIRRGRGFCIYVLYEKKQLVEYSFRESACLKEYAIIYHTVEDNREYLGFCPLENDILFYSDKEIFFESDPAKSFHAAEDIQLRRITNAAILAEQEQYTKLILHSFVYRENHMVQLIPNEKKELQVLDQKGYLYVDEASLFLQQGETHHFIAYLNMGVECFTAVRTNGSSLIKVYLKYRDSIQMIRYSFEEKRKTYKEFKLPQNVVFTRMRAVKENLLYGISERTVYLFDLSVPEIQMHELHIEVKCRSLILENADGAEKVQSETEYLMLKKASV